MVALAKPVSHWSGTIDVVMLMDEETAVEKTAVKEYADGWRRKIIRTINAVLLIYLCRGDQSYWQGINP
jgi:hypothetical protein